jgi:hypothetical protein
MQLKGKTMTPSRKIKVLTSFIFMVLANLSNLVAQDDRPIFARDRDNRLIMGNQGGNTPISDIAGVVPCRSSTLQDVFLWRNPESKGNAQNPGGISYFYSPCLFFQQDLQTGGIKIETRSYAEREYDLISLWVVRADTGLIHDIVDHISHLEQVQLAPINLIPVPMAVFEVAPAHPWIFEEGVQIYAGYPDYSDHQSGMFSFSNVFRLDFEVPHGVVDEFIWRIRDGLSFYIRYGYKGQNTSTSFLSANSEINISSELNHEFFGDRDQVWATKEQLLEYYTQVGISNQVRIKLDDRQLFGQLYSQAERFLSAAEGSSKELGDLALKEYVTLFKLADNDVFMTPDHTTETTLDKETFRENMQSMKEFNKSVGGSEFNAGLVLNPLQEIAEKVIGTDTKDESGGFKLGPIQLGGKIKGKDSEINSETLVKTVIKDALKENWKGLKVNPLSIRMYSVMKGDLQRQASTTFEIETTDGEEAVNWIATIRDTAKDVSYLDEAEYGVLVTNIPKLKVKLRQK